MVKVVQFLEIGNLPKSQLNPCRSRKVMIKNLNFQFQRADQRTIFTTFFESRCNTFSISAQTAPQTSTILKKTP